MTDPIFPEAPDPCPDRSKNPLTRAFLAPDDSLCPRGVKVSQWAAEGFRQFKEFVILDAAHAAFDLGQQGAADIPPSPLTNCSEAGLADAAGNAKPADLRTDNVFSGGSHGFESSA